MIRRPPRSTPLYSSAASDVYKRQLSLSRSLSLSLSCSGVGWVGVTGGWCGARKKATRSCAAAAPTLPSPAPSSAITPRRWVHALTTAFAPLVLSADRPAGVTFGRRGNETVAASFRCARIDLIKDVAYFSVCACHPCTRAMLIFCVPFQFYWVMPEGSPSWLTIMRAANYR